MGKTAKRGWVATLGSETIKQEHGKNIQREKSWKYLESPLCKFFFPPFTDFEGGKKKVGKASSEDRTRGY